MTQAKLLALSAIPALALALTAAAPAQQAAHELPKVEKVTVNAPVTLTEDADSWTLDNGIVKMTVLKKNGNMSTMVYHGVTIPNTRSEYWEQVPTGTITSSVTIDPASNGGERAEVSVKGVNPGDPNAPSPFGGPPPMQRGPGGPTGPGLATAPVGAGAPGAAPGPRGPGGAGGPRPPAGPRGGGMDIEVRYVLERGTSGFYTYAEYTHHANYPPAGEGESRFILQMNPAFDWLSVDQDRNMLMSNALGGPGSRGIVVHAKEQSIYTSGIYKNSVEHKYSYNQDMYKLTAWGWSSTKNHIGVYFINPSNEYIGGGPEKLDLIDHMGATLLDYWTSGHYGGGAGNNLPHGEEWKHVVGPIFVYMNALADPKDPTQADLDQLKATSGSGMPAVPAIWHDNALALWNDAVAKSKEVKAAWPYNWVSGVDYPHKDGRGSVTGQLVLNDPQAASKRLPHLNVGLSHPNYTRNTGGYQLRGGNGNIVTWAHDGNYYQFWTDGAEDGKFTIANVRPGHYTLHAFADGVLGEYAKVDINVEAGKKVDLGKLDWQPVRYGKQVWEIGYPDRIADKFYKGDGANYWLWGWPLRYGDLFPNDITYTIGKSDYHKDWFFEEVPHSDTEAWKNPDAKDPLNQRFGWVAIPPSPADPWPQWGHGKETTWTVKFTMPKASKGQGIVRIALAGADGGNGTTPAAPGSLTIGVNGQPVGTIHPVATNALRYNTDKGVWYQYDVTFDATLLKPGENTMTFTVPAGDVTTGVVWDYVRLELNDGSKPYPTPPENGRPDYPTLETTASSPAQSGATAAR
jgi:rhamnogalacturonan endolyase